MAEVKRVATLVVTKPLWLLQKLDDSLGFLS